MRSAPTDVVYCVAVLEMKRCCAQELVVEPDSPVLAHRSSVYILSISFGMGKCVRTAPVNDTGGIP